MKESNKIVIATYDKYTGILYRVYNSKVECVRGLNTNHYNLKRTYSKSHLTCKGYFIREFITGQDIPKKITVKHIRRTGPSKRIAAYNKYTGNLYKVYDKQTDFGIEFSISSSLISLTLHSDDDGKPCGDYILRRVNDESIDELPKSIKTKFIDRICRTYTLDGIFIKEYDSISHLANELGIYNSRIYNVVDKPNRSIHNMMVRFAEGEKTKKIPALIRGYNSSKNVVLYSIDGDYINNFYSITELSKYLNITTSGVVLAIKRRGVVKDEYMIKYSSGDLEIDKKPIDIGM